MALAIPALMLEVQEMMIKDLRHAHFTQTNKAKVEEAGKTKKETKHHDQATGGLAQDLINSDEMQHEQICDLIEHQVDNPTLPYQVDTQMLTSILAIESNNLLNMCREVIDLVPEDCIPQRGLLDKATSNQQVLLRIDNLLQCLREIALDLSNSYYAEALIMVHALLTGEHTAEVQEKLVNIGFIVRLEEIQENVWTDKTESIRRLLFKFNVLHIMKIFCEHPGNKYFLLNDLCVKDILATNGAMEEKYQRYLDFIPVNLCEKSGASALLATLLHCYTDARDLAHNKLWPLLVNILKTFSFLPCEKMFMMELLCSSKKVMNNIITEVRNKYIQSQGIDLLTHLTECNPYAIKELSGRIASRPCLGRTCEDRIRRFMMLLETHFVQARKFIENLYLMGEKAEPSFPVRASVKSTDPKVLQLELYAESGLLVKYVSQYKVFYLKALLYVLLKPGFVSEADKKSYVVTVLAIFVLANKRRELRECVADVMAECSAGDFADSTLITCLRNVLSIWRDDVMPDIPDAILQNSSCSWDFWNSTIDYLGDFFSTLPRQFCNDCL